MSLLFFYNELKNNKILDKFFNDYEIIDDGYVKLKNKNLKLYGKVVKINHELNDIVDIINKDQKITKTEIVNVSNIYNSVEYICFILL